VFLKSPCKVLQEPQARLATVAAAGAEQVPFTTGLLIGIGETRAERLDTLFAIRDLHAAHGHIQVQSLLCCTLITQAIPEQSIFSRRLCTFVP